MLIFSGGEPCHLGCGFEPSSVRRDGSQRIAKGSGCRWAPNTLKQVLFICIIKPQSRSYFYIGSPRDSIAKLGSQAGAAVREERTCKRRTWRNFGSLFELWACWWYIYIYVRAHEVNGGFVSSTRGSNMVARWLPDATGLGCNVNPPVLMTTTITVRTASLTWIPPCTLSSTVDSNKLEYGCRMIHAGFACFCFGVGGRSRSNFLASTAISQMSTTITPDPVHFVHKHASQKDIHLTTLGTTANGVLRGGR